MYADGQCEAHLSGSCAQPFSSAFLHTIDHDASLAGTLHLLPVIVRPVQLSVGQFVKQVVSVP